MWLNYNPDLELDAFIAQYVLGWEAVGGSQDEGSITFATQGKRGTPELIVCTNNRESDFTPSLREDHLRFALAEVSQYGGVDGIEYSDGLNQSYANLRFKDQEPIRGTGTSFLRAACDALRTLYKNTNHTE